MKKNKKYLKKEKRKLKRLLFLIPIIIFIIILGFVSPENITQTVGEKNTYIAMFFIALIWGMSVFSSIPYPLFLITFALWWANPFILASITTIGVIGGDSLSYFVGRKWKNFIRGKSEEIFEKILWLYESKDRYLTIFFFLYWVFAPFPNDLITFSAGLKRYNYFKMVIPLTLGNFIFCNVLAYFSEYFARYF